MLKRAYNDIGVCLDQPNGGILACFVVGDEFFGVDFGEPEREITKPFYKP